MLLEKSLIGINSLLDFILPRACLICRMTTREKHHLCQPCANELPILTHSCEKCAQYLYSAREKNLICGQCLIKPPPYHKVYALFPYLFPIPRLIAGFKFDARFSYGSMLSRFMLKAVREQWYAHEPLPDLIIPMPLHHKRLKERGFNQALELARPVARALNLQLDYLGVKRIKATQPQSTLPARLRKQNVANAFSSNRIYRGLHIAVVDDVMTTGQTVTALARVLKNQGAARIDVWCCARCN